MQPPPPKRPVSTRTVPSAHPLYGKSGREVLQSHLVPSVSARELSAFSAASQMARKMSLRHPPGSDADCERVTKGWRTCWRRQPPPTREWAADEKLSAGQCATACRNAAVKSLTDFILAKVWAEKDPEVVSVHLDHSEYGFMYDVLSFYNDKSGDGTAWVVYPKRGGEALKRDTPLDRQELAALIDSELGRVNRMIIYYDASAAGREPEPRHFPRGECVYKKYPSGMERCVRREYYLPRWFVVAPPTVASDVVANFWALQESPDPFTWPKSAAFQEDEGETVDKQYAMKLLTAYEAVVKDDRRLEDADVTWLQNVLKRTIGSDPKWHDVQQKAAQLGLVGDDEDEDE